MVSSMLSRSSPGVVPICADLQDFALACGIPLVDAQACEGWHSASGNGMIVPNVGMAVLAFVSCLEPRGEKYDPHLELAIRNRELLGVPESLKYHHGYKKWKLDIGGAAHYFAEKDTAVMAADWTAKTKRELEPRNGKDLKQELTKGGQKSPRLKSDMVEAVVRFRFKHGSLKCSCCTSNAKDRNT